MLIVFQPPIMQQLDPDRNESGCLSMPAILLRFIERRPSIRKGRKFHDTCDRRLGCSIIAYPDTVPAARSQLHRFRKALDPQFPQHLSCSGVHIQDRLIRAGSIEVIDNAIVMPHEQIEEML